MFAKRNVDPELEKLRNEVDGPPNLDTVTLNIQRLTTQIHAAYLFENEGKPTLQKLCLLLSSTASGKIYNGWQEFATHIGLTAEQIRCIEYDFKGLQDSTYYVLLAYVQSSDATLDKIVNALQKIERLDIINQIKDCICNLIDSIPYNINTNDLKTRILRPDNLPRVPLVLSPIIPIDKKLKESVTITTNVSHQVIQWSIPIKPTNAGQTYGSIVMLTFTEDGLNTANHITKVFRSKQPKIGVVILQEQQKYVYSRAEEFIDDCFNQVNYVIPVLTKGYVKRINSHFVARSQSQITLDEKYLKYIYSLLRFEYVKNNCCNNRVRCIVPDEEVYTIAMSSLHPTLQAWFRESDIDAFTENILLKKF